LEISLFEKLKKEIKCPGCGNIFVLKEEAKFLAMYCPYCRAKIRD